MRVRGWDEDGKIYMKGFRIGRWNEKVREGRGEIAREVIYVVVAS